MGSPRKARLAPLVVCVSLACTGSTLGEPLQNHAQEVSAIAHQFSSVDEFIRAEIEKQRIPGLSLSVVKNGNYLFEAAYGFADAEHRVKATTTTPFYTASVTKAFTGTALIVLEEQNKLNLDHPVNDYLPAAKVHSPAWDASAATVRRVANHTAGLSTYNRKCNVEDSSCHTSTITAIEQHGILFWPPGDHFDYSNIGYGALGVVVTQAAGKPFEEFLEQDIFEPLRMRDCYLQTAPQLRAGSSLNYASGTLARTPVQTSDTPGASSARCSSRDLAAFGSFVLGSPLPEQRQILPSARLHELLYSNTASAGEKYSFGWDANEVEGYGGVFAQGGTYDSFALLQVLPDQNIAIAIVANTGTTLPFEIANRIVRQLLPARRSPHPDQQKNKSR